MPIAVIIFQVKHFPLIYAVHTIYISMYFLFSSAKMEQGNLTFQVFYVAVNNPRLDKPNWRLASSTLSMQCSGSPKSKQGKLVTSFLWM